MTLTSAIESVRGAVVQVSLHAVDRDGTYRQRWGKPFLAEPIGTGFLVNEEAVVVTANHVLVEGAKAIGILPNASLHIGLAQPNSEHMRGNFTLVGFEVLLQDDLHDVAVLRLQQNPFRGEIRSGIRIGDKDLPMLFATAKLDPARPSDGTAIAVSGYPLSSAVLVSTSGHVASSWGFEVKEVELPNAPAGFRMPQVSDAYIGDVEVNPGNSGGPVYRVEDGVVIGVCVAVRTAPVLDPSGQSAQNLAFTTGLSVIVPVRYVIDALEKVGMSWERSA